MYGHAHPPPPPRAWHPPPFPRLSTDCSWCLLLFALSFSPLSLLLALCPYLTLSFASEIVHLVEQLPTNSQFWKHPSLHQSVRRHRHRHKNRHTDTNTDRHTHTHTHTHTHRHTHTHTHTWGHESLHQWAHVHELPAPSLHWFERQLPPAYPQEAAPNPVCTC
jgi:hypothetical protein